MIKNMIKSEIKILSNKFYKWADEPEDAQYMEELFDGLFTFRIRLGIEKLKHKVALDLIEAYDPAFAGDLADHIEEDEI